MLSLPRIPPGDSGLRAVAGQIQATARAELLMQWRRWGLWVTFGLVAGLLILLTVQATSYLLHLPPTSLYVRQRYTSGDLDNLVIYNTTIYGILFLGLVTALLVVDRTRRDQHLGMAELQRATPQGYAGYVLGKFLGNYMAMLVPALLTYLLCAVITLLMGWPAMLLQKFLLAFLVVYLPSSLAVVSTTFFLASFLPLRIVQVGFSLLWLYFNTGLGRYGFGASIFNPNGLYAYPVFFPLTTPMPTVYPNFKTSMQLALLNMTVLLLSALVALLLTYGSLALRRHHEEEA